jgi:hypothetical protein
MNRKVTGAEEACDRKGRVGSVGHNPCDVFVSVSKLDRFRTSTTMLNGVTGQLEERENMQNINKKRDRKCLC